MYKEREVRYNSDRGHVSVEIKNTGFVNLGSFSVHITDGVETRKLGDGKFGDNIPDVFLINIPPDHLENWTLMVIGSYSPAFGHDQISVDYNFLQQAEPTDDPEQIRVQAPALSTHHDFFFKSR
jgi:hypothetical protein